MKRPILIVSTVAVISGLCASVAGASALATRDMPFYAFVRGYACYQPPTVFSNSSIFVSLTQTQPPYGFALMRVKADGAFDPTWGDGGVAHLPRNEGMFPVAGGKYLIIGRQPIRLMPTGSIDPTYRGDDLPPFRIRSAAVQPDGSLVIAMDDERPFGVGDYRLVFVRFGPDGRRDPSFGTSGILATPISMVTEYAFAWAVRHDGSVDVSSYASVANGWIDPVLRRFDGVNAIPLAGPRRVPEHGVANWIAGNVKVDAAGAALIAGSGSAAAVWRFGPDGALDESFDPQGRIAAGKPVETGGVLHTESAVALWQAPGGGWIMPFHAQDTVGSGWFARPGSSSAPVVVFDNAGTRTSLLAEFLEGSAVSEPVRMDDGGFLYRSSFHDCNILKAKGPPPRVEATMVEYHHPQLDHFFMTLDGAESATLDAQPALGWVRTGHTFGAWMPVDQPGTARVCRFHTEGRGGSYSHFYTSEGAECDGLRDLEARTPPNAPAWRFEGMGFSAAQPRNGRCAGNLVPVYRAYNRGFERGLTVNHRYTADPTTYAAMLAKGWAAEGVRFCVPPANSR